MFLLGKKLLSVGACLTRRTRCLLSFRSRCQDKNWVVNECSRKTRFFVKSFGDTKFFSSCELFWKFKLSKKLNWPGGSEIFNGVLLANSRLLMFQMRFLEEKRELWELRDCFLLHRCALMPRLKLQIQLQMIQSRKHHATSSRHSLRWNAISECDEA